MTTRGSTGDDAALMALMQAIASGDGAEVARRLAESPDLGGRAIVTGASRQGPRTYFLSSVGHHVYRGDTALHIAAAAYQSDTAEALLAGGAQVGASNRRGATPLHYAADGLPGSARWDPRAQARVIECLAAAGADPNSVDKNGVTPLHRAVRTRSADAVRTLLVAGADPVRRNGSGSTPLHLAVQNTGRSESGTPASHDQQREIIVLLLHAGARPQDEDAKGRSVEQSATSAWVREVLDASR